MESSIICQYKYIITNDALELVPHKFELNTATTCYQIIFLSTVGIEPGSLRQTMGQSCHSATQGEDMVRPLIYIPVSYVHHWIQKKTKIAPPMWCPITMMIWGF